MLHLINTYSGGNSQHRCPLAFSAAAPQCRVVAEMIGAGFSTAHYSSQLVRRGESSRLHVREKHRFADETVQHAHVINVKRGDADGNIPASLLASCWWFARHHPQHVPIALLLTGDSITSLEGLRTLDFAPRVATLYVTDSSTAAGPRYLSPLATLVNVRKVCELSNCGDMRWMLSCPRLASVDTVLLDKPIDWNAGEVLPALPALTDLTLYMSGEDCLSWLPKCTKLTRVDLDDCVWLEDCDVFSAMPELTVLKLAADELSDISGLTQCPKLRVLELAGARGLSDASSIGTLHNLEKLRIAYTSITDISWIRDCAALEELSLLSIDVEHGLDSLAELRRLRSLALDGLAWFDFDWVSRLSCLEEVSVQYSRGTGTFLRVEQLRNAQMLRKLSLPELHTHAWLHDCVMLEELSMLCDANAWATMNQVFTLPRLRKLQLTLSGDGGNGDALSTATALAVYPDSSSRLETLTVVGRGVTADATLHLLGCISRCTNLRSLMLKGVSLCGASEAWLEPLALLQELDVTECETSGPELDGVAALPEMRKLTLYNARGWPGFRATWMCCRLEKLDIHSCSTLADLSAFATGASMRHLSHIRLGNVPFVDLSFLQHTPFVRDLIVVSLPRLESLSAVSSCQALRTFTLDCCPLVVSLDGLQSCTSLLKCQVSHCDGLENTDALGALPALVDVSFSAVPRMTTLSLVSVQELEALSIIDCAALMSVAMPHRAARLTQLTVQACPLLRTLPSLDQCGQLEELSLKDNPQLEALPTLHGCARLAIVRLDKLAVLGDVSELLTCRDSVRHVRVSACPSLTNVEVLSGLPHLKYLDLSNAALTDLVWVGKCTTLTSLALCSCTGTTDYSAIAKLTQLERGFISDCPLEDISWTSVMCSPPMIRLHFSSCVKLTVSDPDALPTFVCTW